MRSGRLAIACGGPIAGLLCGVMAIQAAATPASTPALTAPTRTFHFTYTTAITDLPTQAKQVRIWVPLATDHENQRVLSRQVTADHPYRLARETAFGNEILYMELAQPIPARVTITVDYDAAVQGGSPQGAEPSPALSSQERAFWLRNEPLMSIDETVTKLAREATAGTTDEMTKTRAIYDYVVAHMTYDKTAPGWGRGDTARACLIGKGNCTDFHSLFISMARAVGIPARFVIGAPIPAESTGEIPGYHCWAECFIAGRGWMPVDASEAWKHPERRDYYFGTPDPNKFLISMGRNLELVPAQAAAAVNLFVYPYVEVDDTPFQAIATRFQFQDRQPEEARI